MEEYRWGLKRSHFVNPPPYLDRQPEAIFSILRDANPKPRLIEMALATIHLHYTVEDDFDSVII